jgi:hypothetical protein
MISEASSTLLEGDSDINTIGYDGTNSTAEYTPLEVLTSLCLLCGVIQVYRINSFV